MSTVGRRRYRVNDRSKVTCFLSCILAFRIQYIISIVYCKSRTGNHLGVGQFLLHISKCSVNVIVGLIVRFACYLSCGITPVHVCLSQILTITEYTAFLNQNSIQFWLGQFERNNYIVQLNIRSLVYE